MIERDWHNCYADSWKGEIVDKAFSHPAKFSRGLIRNIYAHALEQGWIEAGDTVLDCFAGVGLGARDAIPLGLNWVGIELEEKFVDLGRKNIALWEFRNRGQQYNENLPVPGKAVLLQGDSRYLCEVLRETGVVVSSPPYLNKALGDGEGPGSTGERHGQETSTEIAYQGGNTYSSNPSNLGNLPAGDFDGVIGSPPFQDSDNRGASKMPDDYFVRSDGRPFGEGKSTRGTLDDPANLGNLPEGDIDITIGSPPYISGGHHPDQTGAWGGQSQNVPKDLAGYGESEGQIGRMPEGDFDAMVGSPPYSQALSGKTNQTERDRQHTISIGRNPDSPGAPYPRYYGESDGQLGKMPPGEFDAAVGSPPYEGNRFDGGEESLKKRQGFHKGYSPDGGYSENSPGQLGTESGETFWSASREIMQQVHSVLKPGAVAIWVLKAFVRDKAIVDFPMQWKQLGESCGFETIEWIRAWLVENRGTQYTLDGEMETKTIARKSFFRRLYEDKYPENSIDFEIVLVQRKAL